MRSKIKTTLFLAFLTIFVSQAFAQKRMGGLALYTVRQEMAEDPIATLQAVADAGYKYVEAAGYKDGKFYGMEPKVFKETLVSMGLEPMSTHMNMVTMENADQLIAESKAAGFKYFVIPVPPMGHFKFDRETRSRSIDDIKAVSDILKTIGEKCSAAGLRLLYHNHDFEFVADENGVVPIEYLLENSDPKHVNFQMDLYWVTKAGKDPVAYFEKYPGRFKSWHVKDMDAEGNFAPVSEGTIDFKRILAQKKLSGMEYYLVEQDRTFDKKPLEVIKISMAGLKENGFK